MVGVPANEVLESAEIGALLVAERDALTLRTHRHLDYLRWRYGSSPLGYRAAMAADDVEGGVAFFRLRRRGRALEAAICEILVPGGDGRASGALAKRVLRLTGADYAVMIGQSLRGGGFVPLPNQGPTLAWRGVVEKVMPGERRWTLSLGDVELF